MERHFKYELDNGKVVNIPLVQVDNLKKNLGISTNEAIVLWLEDNGYEINQEQVELDKVAKANKPKTNAKSTTERKKVVRERKPNPDKEYIIGCIAEYLKGVATNVNIENVGKLITFTYNNKNFKFDLTETRQSKEK